MKNKTIKKILLLILTVVLILNSMSMIVFSADESVYVASYEIEASKTVVHPGDTIDVYVNLSTNYAVFAAQMAVLYSSNVFEVVIPEGMSASNASYLTNIGDLGAYTMAGNAASADSLYLRNANAEYWSSKVNEYKIAFASFAGDSNMGQAVISNGRIVKFTLKVKENVEFGTSGEIFMHSDWIKNDACRSGLIFVSRSVNGDFNTASGSFVAMGQTIDLSNAKTTVTVAHTETDWIIEKQPTEAERGHKYKTCTVCNKVTQKEEIPAFNEGFKVSGTVKTFDDGVDNSDVTTITFTKSGETTPAYTVITDGSGVLDFSLETVKNGTYNVIVSKVNHATRTYELEVDSNTAIDMQINLFGDVTGDGQVRMNDMSIINAHVKETKLLEDYALTCADVTDDGQVRMNDMSRVNAHVKETGYLWK